MAHSCYALSEKRQQNFSTNHKLTLMFGLRRLPGHQKPRQFNRMKKLNLLVTTLAAATVASSAVAQVFTYTPTDVILAVRKDGGSTDTLINLGPISGFTSLSTGVYALNRPYGNTTTTIASVLTSTFGANLDGVTYSFFAGSAAGSGASTFVAATRSRPSLGTQSTPWLRQPSGGLSSTTTSINTLGNAAANDALFTASSGATTGKGYVNIPSGNPESYSVNIKSSGDFGNFSGSIETGPISGKGFADFYNVLAQAKKPFGNATYLGFFILNNNGTVGFDVGNAPLVPEPSTYAGVFAAGLVGFGLWRRATAKK